MPYRYDDGNRTICIRIGKHQSVLDDIATSIGRFQFLQSEVLSRSQLDQVLDSIDDAEVSIGFPLQQHVETKVSSRLSHFATVLDSLDRCPQS